MNRLFVLLLLSVPCYLQAQVSQKPLETIAFGSCSRESEPEQLWEDIVGQHPDLWIWTGDNIYGDSHDMSVLQAKYDKQKSHPGYQNLIKTCPIIGTWDDHDYGMNDGGKFFSKKKEAKSLALDFLDVPKNAPVRNRPGLYDSYVYGPEGKRVRIILLDTRSFRDTVIVSSIKGRRYDPNPKGDILGKAQWKWLKGELSKKDANVTIIVSSIQLLANEHYYEKWGNFPKAYSRMIKLLEETKPKNTFFLSGDRHIGEISRINVNGLPYPLYDFTSSGLTHTWGNDMNVEPNALRVGQLIIKKNFGVIRIDWSKPEPTLIFELRGKDNALWQSIPVSF